MAISAFPGWGVGAYSELDTGIVNVGMFIIIGVVPMDLLGVIRILVANGHFTIMQYNNALQQLGFYSYEAGDKPYPVPTSRSSKISKLKGKAVSNLVHVRNWPLVVKNLLKDLEDPVITFGLLLHEIVERLTAQEFFQYEIDIVENKIVEYLDLRKSIRSNYPNLLPSAKPKHHFLRRIHYLIYTKIYYINNGLNREGGQSYL